MKNTTLFIATVAGITISSVCSADEHNIIINIPQSTPEEVPSKPHAPARPVAQGYYDMESSILYLNFNRNMENCTIEVSSTAGDYHIENLSSSNSSVSLVLSGAPGLYVIALTFKEGAQIGTQFLVF
ncbi:MAG: hypothetical protein IJV32_01145 [Bacteroidales bacterium]|nr:hypothetical protein [Bacteroidales bacterium]